MMCVNDIGIDATVGDYGQRVKYGNALILADITVPQN